MDANGEKTVAAKEGEGAVRKQCIPTREEAYDGIRNAALLRLRERASVPRWSGAVPEHMRTELEAFLRTVMREVLTVLAVSKQSMVSVGLVNEALDHLGHSVYGIGRRTSAATALMSTSSRGRKHPHHDKTHVKEEGKPARKHTAKKKEHAEEEKKADA